MRAGTYDQFEKRFEPVEFGDGEILRDQLAEANNRLVWTVVDCDGKLYLSPGWRFVNRMGYVLCKKPWADEMRDYVY